LSQTKAAAAEVLSKEKRLDGIANNAGVMAVPYLLTEVVNNALGCVGDDH
jgi:NAD(P)-dependent dehydrogenase (short-subunit alcohol dehydrogenase family)